MAETTRKRPRVSLLAFCFRKAIYVPLWAVLSCQAGMASGTLFGGWRIVRTMGSKITRLTPVQGFCAETGGALTLFAATWLGIPVSTTHTITGAIVAVGAARRVSAVRCLGLPASGPVKWVNPDQRRYALRLPAPMPATWSNRLAAIPVGSTRQQAYELRDIADVFEPIDARDQSVGCWGHKRLSRCRAIVVELRKMIGPTGGLWRVCVRPVDCV